MARFAMYVIDLEEALVFGTNDVEEINALFELFDEDRFIVIHSTYGDYAQGRNTPEPIQMSLTGFYELRLLKGEDEDD